MISVFWHVELVLAGLMFDPEDGRSIFLRNAGKLLPDHTALIQKIAFTQLFH
jgi:hypothetical protein